MAKVSVTINNAPVEKVWDALTRPELIRKWFYGTDTVTDWELGSPIVWRGVWEGKQYEDKGKVLEVRRPERLSYTHWSSFSGKPDEPDNYVVVVCDLHAGQGNTILTIDQNCPEEERQACEMGWNKVLDALKALFD